MNKQRRVLFTITYNEMGVIIDTKSEDVAQLTPCDVCRHNPPSSTDGKPCCVCPAERREE